MDDDYDWDVWRRAGMTTAAYHEIYIRRADMQTLTVAKLAAMSDCDRGTVEAFTLNVDATQACSCGDCDELGTVCGPPSFGYELGLTCAAKAVESWLSDPHCGPREVLTLEVKL